MGRTLVRDLRMFVDPLGWGIMEGHFDGIKLGCSNWKYKIGNGAKVIFWLHLWWGFMEGHFEGIKLGCSNWKYKIGNDARVIFWLDLWCGSSTLFFLSIGSSTLKPIFHNSL